MDDLLWVPLGQNLEGPGSELGPFCSVGQLGALPTCSYESLKLPPSLLDRCFIQVGIF